MALGPRLDLRQSQTLAMTPQLQQAIKLLALSNLEIEAFIGEALDNNPLLEAGDLSQERSATLDQLVGGRVVRRVFAHLVGRGGALHPHLARLEQRIRLQRLADERLDLEVRQRQQLDCLLKLRRHHQRLRLA